MDSLWQPRRVLGEVPAFPCAAGPGGRGADGQAGGTGSHGMWVTSKPRQRTADRGARKGRESCRLQWAGGGANTARRQNSMGRGSVALVWSLN